MRNQDLTSPALLENNQALNDKTSSPEADDFSVNESLVQSVLQDIFKVGWFHLLLLILILISSISVVLVTYETRNQISHRDRLLEERVKLDDEWSNLILEENSLAEHSRVQRLATKELDMIRPDADKEVIVNFK